MKISNGYLSQLIEQVDQLNRSLKAATQHTGTISRTQQVIPEDSQSKVPTSLLEGLEHILQSRGGDNSRVSEQDLYAGSIYSKLHEVDPERATEFLNRFDTFLNQIYSRKGKVNVYRAARRALQSMTKDGILSRDQFQNIQQVAVGKSQLDTNRSWMSADTDQSVKSVEQALTQYLSNTEATHTEMSEFRKTRVKRLREAKHLRRLQGGGAVSGSGSNASASAPGGFVWKPHSESDGNLVIILPTSMTGRAQSVSVLSADGNRVIASGRYTGVANGGRLHYRFSKPGGSFPPGAIVQIRMADGSVQQIKIPSTGSRVG